MEKQYITIFYEMNIGGQLKDKSLWTGIYENGEAFDYGGKEHLKIQAIKDGYGFLVWRRHKDGSRTLMEKSDPPKE